MDTMGGILKRLERLEAVEYPGAWLAYTPTITAASGTFTTVSATGLYARVGNVINANVSITITTNGSAAGAIIITLPAAATSSAVGCGRENTATGDLLQVYVAGGGSTATVYTYSNAYPGGNGRTLYLSVTYPV